MSHFAAPAAPLRFEQSKTGSDLGSYGCYRADVQGIRALAVTLVVLYHAGFPVSGGYVGVDVFFVVSGFVISGLLLRDLDGTGQTSLGNFYRRRIRRLVPAAALMSVVTLIGSVFLLSPIDKSQDNAAWAASAASLFSANAYFFAETGGYFQQLAILNPFVHMWSLSVEEQFYVAFPATLVILWRFWHRSRRQLMIVITFLIGVSFLYEYLCTYQPQLALPSTFAAKSAEFAFYSPMTRAWEFLIGVLVQLVIARRRTPKAWAISMQIVGLGLVLATALTFTDATIFPGFAAWLPVLGTAMLLVGGNSRDRGPVTTIFSLRLMVWLGGLSYAWYLWHWPFIVFARNLYPAVPWAPALAAFFALGIAAVTHHYLEEPIHRGRILRSNRAWIAILLVGVLVPISVGLLVHEGWQRSWGIEQVKTLKAEILPRHLDETSGCSNSEPLGTRNPSKCTWTVPHPRGMILLTGDSNAGQFSEPALAAARAEGYDLMIVNNNDGCPMAVADTYPSASCQRFVEGNLSYLLEHPHMFAVVIIANSLSPPVDSGNRYAASVKGRVGESAIQHGIRGWARGVAQVVSSIGKSTRIIMVEPIPHNQDTSYPGCMYPTILQGFDFSCAWISPHDVASQYRDEVNTSVRQNVGKRATYLDTATILCRPPLGCSSFVDSNAAYKDTAHLSVVGANAFAGSFERALR